MRALKDFFATLGIMSAALMIALILLAVVLCGMDLAARWAA